MDVLLGNPQYHAATLGRDSHVTPIKLRPNSPKNAPRRHRSIAIRDQERYC